MRFMNAHSENEPWIIHAGDEVIRRRASAGAAALSARDRLIYCLWIADYGMRNAGDLSQAHILHPTWKTEAVQMAQELSLDFTRKSFALSRAALQRQYFKRFERICAEIRAPSPAPEQTPQSNDVWSRSRRWFRP